MNLKTKIISPFNDQLFLIFLNILIPDSRPRFLFIPD